VKYGDLSNQASKDYIFDIDRFTSAEGNTGPYILYTIVRCKSILAKAGVDSVDGAILPAHSDSERGLQLELTKFMAALSSAYEDMAPHKICAYIYDLANAFNRFYHDTKILAEEDEATKASYLKLLVLTRSVLEKSIDLLGFNAPERM
ncbi:MAG: arginine--tRNA ligase, partial [Pseudobutyrivibrio sp.]|nr:arginine--tRNA ligase [Pseudobutyrivibrio sp.]